MSREPRVSPKPWCTELYKNWIKCVQKYGTVEKSCDVLAADYLREQCVAYPEAPFPTKIRSSEK